MNAPYNFSLESLNPPETNFKLPIPKKTPLPSILLLPTNSVEKKFVSR